MKIDVMNEADQSKIAHYICIDLDAREEIPRVRFADDETGEYHQFVIDQNGSLVPNNDMTDAKVERKFGNIMIVKLNHDSPILVARPHYEPGEKF